MVGYLKVMLWYAGPFIALGILWLLLAMLAAHWEGKYPRFYKSVSWVNDNSFKVLAAIVIIAYLYYHVTQGTTYDYNN